MAFTIPAAFAINAETEEEAAKILSDILVAADIVGNKTDNPSSIVDCWWLPNHPKADGSDRNDPKLIWIDYSDIETLIKNSV